MENSDHDLLIQLWQSSKDMIKDINEIKDIIRQIPIGCRAVREKCGIDFVQKSIYDIQYNQLKTSMDENFKRAKEEQQEERRKNRWFITIIVTTINIIVNLGIFLLNRGGS